MAEETTSSFPTDRREGSGRGGRSQGNRDAGGFRIRLSDNELQAARVLQEAFGLRSTVAVLGFALRTLAQQLEAGQLDELVASQRAQAGPRGASGGGGERRRERPEGRDGGRPARGQRIDPFARPSRPAAAVEPGPESGEVPVELNGEADLPTDEAGSAAADAGVEPAAAAEVADDVASAEA